MEIATHLRYVASILSRKFELAQPAYIF